MAINRRTFFTAIFATAGYSWSSQSALPVAVPNIYLSARQADGNLFRVSGFTLRGEKAFDVELAGRGHSGAIHPNKKSAVFFARRPGKSAVVIDIASGQVEHVFTTPDNRHFYGHGVFSGSGSLLYATENDFDNARGVIGIYSSLDNYMRIGELDSYGIGPHEMSILSDDRTLVVANGGILTNPQLPRIKLNVPEMKPSLCFVDRFSGKCSRRIYLQQELHQLSIRHLSVGRNDTVAVAMQYEGPKGDLVPLIAIHQIRESASTSNEKLSLIEQPARVIRAMRNYCGSVCFDSSGTIIAVSAPRGNLVTFWNAMSSEFISSVEVVDGSGIARGTQKGEFIVSSGMGDLFVVDSFSKSPRALTMPFDIRTKWDNHLVSVE